MEDVEAATRDDVEAFFRRFYVPGNASLALVGDIDEDEALRPRRSLLRRPPGRDQGAQTLDPLDWPGRAEVAITVHDRVELDRVYLAWHTVPQFSADDSALVLSRTSSAGVSRAGSTGSWSSSGSWRRTPARTSRAGSWPGRSA